MNKSITIRQIICAVIMLCITLIHEHIPKGSAQVAGNGGIISIILGAVIAVIIAYFVYYLIKSYPGCNIYDMMKISLGTFVAKTILVITLLWAGINLVTVLHFHALISQNTFIPFTPERQIFLYMLALVGYCLYKGIKVAMRISELLISLFIFNLIFLILVAIPHFQISNLLPITLADTPNIVKATPYSFTVFGLIIFALFYADKLDKPQSSFKPYLLYILTVFILAFSITVISIGVQGEKLTGEFTLPFGSVVKHSSLSVFFERLEAFLLLPSFVSDFVESAFFMSVLLLSIKWLFNMKKIGFVAVPVFIGIYIISLFVETTQFTLESFYKSCLIPINSGFILTLPLILVLATLIRKKRNAANKDTPL